MATAIDISLVLLGIGLAALFGYVAHRASICTVKAVVEIVSTGRAHMLSAFLRTAAWAIVATYLMIWITGIEPVAIRHNPGLDALLGGVIFGMGAAINRGCAFSTLTRLASGDLGMILTLAGLAVGFAAAFLYGVPTDASLPIGILDRPFGGDLIADIGTALAGAWALYEIRRLWRGRDRRSGTRALVMTPHYRLSTAAVLLGLTAGALFFLDRDWVLAASVKNLTAANVIADRGVDFQGAAFLIAMTLGMALSAVLRGSFRVKAPGIGAILGSLVGGALMGYGAAIVPGGNDVLILHGIPLLLPHAIMGFVAMLVGVMLVVLLIRGVTGLSMTVDCHGDLCRDGVDPPPMESRS